MAEANNAPIASTGYCELNNSRNTSHFPQNPISGGIPAAANAATESVIASNGRVRERPESCDIYCTGRFNGSTSVINDPNSNNVTIAYVMLYINKAWSDVAVATGTTNNMNPI